MKIRDAVDIAADPDDVWPYIAIPQRIATWNSNVVAVDRTAQQPVQAGERFGMVFSLSGSERESDVEVVACQPPMLVVYRHNFLVKGRARFAVESYELYPKDRRTHLKQTVDLAGAGIPWVFRLVMWMIGTLGQTKGESFLERLKRNIERSGPVQ